MRTDTDDKRERILQAAQECFTQYGFKRTSMEDIAQAAGISRAALYLLFPNKEAIFRAGLELLNSAAYERAQAAIARPAPIAERLRAALEARNLVFLELMHRSPHGAELVDMHHGIRAELVQHYDDLFNALLVAALAEAEAAGEVCLQLLGITAGDYVALLVAAHYGLKYRSASIADYRRQVERLSQVFAAAVCPATGR